MKRYMWLLLFAILLVGCVPVVYVEFGTSDGDDSVCLIHVDSDNQQPIFHTRPGGSIVSVTEVFALPPSINDEDDYIIIDAHFTVLRYAVINDGYWFEVNIEGLRYVEILLVDPTFFDQSGTLRFSFFGILGETIYEEEGNIATGTYWIPEDQVTGMYNSDDMDCISELESDETASGSLPQVYYCFAHPPSDNVEIEFRIGPGTRRSVRFVAVDPFEYEVLGYALISDVRWLQVNTVDYGLLWVNESHVVTDGTCTNIPEAPVPPTITRFASSEEDACADFYIISPLGQVAEENSLYSWTPVDEADEYVLTFFNYLSELSDVISVDGSQTSVEIYTGSLHTGSLLNFDVTAKNNGEVLCSTGLSGWIERLAPQANTSPEIIETPEIKKKDKKKNRGGYTPPVEEDYVIPEEEDYTSPDE